MHHLGMPKYEDLPQDAPGQTTWGVLTPEVLAILAEYGAKPEDVTLMHAQRRPIEPPPDPDPAA